MEEDPLVMVDHPMEMEDPQDIQIEEEDPLVMVDHPMEMEDPQDVQIEEEPQDQDPLDQ